MTDHERHEKDTPEYWFKAIEGDRPMSSRPAFEVFRAGFELGVSRATAVLRPHVHVQTNDEALVLQRKIRNLTPGPVSDPTDVDRARRTVAAIPKCPRCGSAFAPYTGTCMCLK